MQATQKIRTLPKGLIADMQALKDGMDTLIEEGILAFKLTELTGSGEYENFVREYNLNKEERLLLLLAIAQYIIPELFIKLKSDNNFYNLVPDLKTGQFHASGETFLKLVASTSLVNKITTQHYLGAEHLFYTKGVISLGQVETGVSENFGTLIINPTYKDLFMFNEFRIPRFSAEFPANLLETTMNWDDLVLNPHLKTRLAEMRDSLGNKPKLQADPRLAKHAKKGYHCVFQGPSGTGKTLAAKLLGKYLNRKAFGVDLSMIISKYIGDTSKHLASLFNMAEDKGWILFFDEGDVLFGKRADTAKNDDSGTRNSNEVVAFLLQRIEAYKGLVIISTNLYKNMDAAFARRFELTLNFDILEKPLAVQFWQDNMPQNATLDKRLDLYKLVSDYPLTQAQIVSVIGRAWLMALNRNEELLKIDDLTLCIKDELIK